MWPTETLLFDRHFPLANAARFNPKLGVRSECLPPKLQADGILLSCAARLRWVLMRLENIWRTLPPGLLHYLPPDRIGLAPMMST